jgi:hypothetical protein
VRASLPRAGTRSSAGRERTEDLSGTTAPDSTASIIVLLSQSLTLHRYQVARGSSEYFAGVEPAPVTAPPCVCLCLDRRVRADHPLYRPQEDSAPIEAVADPYASYQPYPGQPQHYASPLSYGGAPQHAGYGQQPQYGQQLYYQQRQQQQAQQQAQQQQQQQQQALWSRTGRPMRNVRRG